MQSEMQSEIGATEAPIKVGNDVNTHITRAKIHKHTHSLANFVGVRVVRMRTLCERGEYS